MFEQGEGNFRNMSRWDTTLVLLTNQVGVGILSLPGVALSIGLVPTVILIVLLGIISYYAAYVLLQYYLAHPHCMNMPDMCRVLGGRAFHIIGSVILVTTVSLSCASAAVTMSVALNTLSGHAICTAGFIGISALICWAFCLPRTFRAVGFVGIPAAGSILVALLIVIISLGVADPKAAPTDWVREVKAFANPTPREAIAATMRVCFAYSGNIGFPSYFPEMKNPKKDFVPALIWLQVLSVVLYTTVAIAIYCLAGQYTASPALGSAPILPAKIAYGFAIFALLSTGMVFGHTAIKFIFVAILRKTKKEDLATQNSVRSWALWVACACAFWALVFVVANSIPVFSSILSAAAAILTAWTTFGISPAFWIHLNWHRLFEGPRQIALLLANAFIILQTLFMNAGGMWATVTELQAIFDDPTNQVTGPFTCADNSLF